MVKARVSSFIKKNKYKFQNVLIKLIIVVIVVAIATIVLSNNKEISPTNNNQVEESYKPSQTVIKGSDVSSKQYKLDDSIVNKFMEYCNTGKIEDAYSLLSDDCKDNLYQTIEKFRENYYNKIFSKKRLYNLQAWISEGKYTIYRIRYTNNMLATGTYEKLDVYQDYITLIKNSKEEKIAIGSFVMSEELGAETNTELIYAKVIKRNIYIEDEEYEIAIKNKTSNTILLDDLKDNKDIILINSSNEIHTTYINKIFLTDITIKPGETKKIRLRFKKTCDSTRKSQYIEFLNIIRNYNEYFNSETDYADTFKAKIKI